MRNKKQMKQFYFVTLNCISFHMDVCAQMKNRFSYISSFTLAYFELITRVHKHTHTQFFSTFFSIRMREKNDIICRATTKSMVEFMNCHCHRLSQCMVTYKCWNVPFIILKLFCVFFFIYIFCCCCQFFVHLLLFSFDVWYIFPTSSILCIFCKCGDEKLCTRNI